MHEELFRQRLMATFKVEAEEYVRSINNGIELIESTLEDHQDVEFSHIESTYRQFHSLKGAAQAVGFDQVGHICQKAESVLSAWKANPSSANLTDLQSVISLTAMVSEKLHISSQDTIGDVSNNGNEKNSYTEETKSDNSEEKSNNHPASASNVSPNASLSEVVTSKVNSINATSNSNSSQSAQNNSTNKNPSEQSSASNADATKSHLSHIISIGANRASETIRISSAKLDSLLRRGEQLVLARINSIQRYEEAQALLSKAISMHQEHLLDLQGNTNQEKIFYKENRFIADLYKLVHNLAADYHELDSQLTALLEEVKRARLAPVRPLMEELELAARRIARQLGKKVRVSIYGSELELDRSIMEALKDPLMHLVRNALDHGLESPEERLKANKPMEGHLSIGIRTHGTSTMEFTVSDDGRGVQTEEVIAAARRQGLIADGVTADSLDLIFSSGVSTRKQVTNISGRGLGMAIVRDKVEDLKGSVRVKTKIGEGTIFELTMPTSFATFNGLLLEEYGRQLVVPLSGVEAVAQFRSSDIKSVEGSQVVNFRNAVIPISRLGQLLGLNESPGHVDRDPCQAIVVTAGGRKAAFLLDEIRGVHEVLSRDLGPQLKKLRFIIGACMIGYQNVVPVLNVADLLTFVRGCTPNKLLSTVTQVPKILVVDDSMTTRTLMRELLENAGYQVTIALDGLQAWEQLHHDSFDLLVSDVDMPGITGFDLTIKIRSDRELKKLPIILVTGQERQEDKQRGLNLGASAYLLKSKFDEGILLETVESLIGVAMAEEHL